jgi:hypothetical protein
MYSLSSKKGAGDLTYCIYFFVIKKNFHKDLYKGLDFSGLSGEIEVAFAPERFVLLSLEIKSYANKKLVFY